MSSDELSKLVGSRFVGRGELWLDPLGNEAEWCDCAIEVADGVIRYEWSYQGKPQQGSYKLTPSGADWTDTWHQTSVMSCPRVAGGFGLMCVTGTYAAPPGPDWGWRSVLSVRPDGDLVLQMTNVTPWGEEGRAVRMVAKRV